jgi:hypothetical protein
MPTKMHYMGRMTIGGVCELDDAPGVLPLAVEADGTAGELPSEAEWESGAGDGWTAVTVGMRSPYLSM